MTRYAIRFLDKFTYRFQTIEYMATSENNATVNALNDLGDSVTIVSIDIVEGR